MEKYFEESFLFDEYEPNEKQKFLVVVIYDIFSNKRRAKFAKFLNGYGFRIQLSAFECKLTNQLYDKLVGEIGRFVADEDLVKVYKLRGDATLKTWGSEKNIENEDYIIV